MLNLALASRSCLLLRCHKAAHPGGGAVGDGTASVVTWAHNVIYVTDYDVFVDDCRFTGSD